MAKKSEPVFDFSQAGHRTWGRSWERTNAKWLHVVRKMAAAADGKVSVDDDEYETLLDQRDELTDELERHVLRVLTSVPDSWLVSNAPDNIDWSEHDSLDYLRADRSESLFTAMAEAKKNNRKN